MRSLAIFVVVLLLQNYRWRPSMFLIVNMMRITSLSIVLWSIVCAFVCTAVDDPTWSLPYQLWLFGTMCIGLFGIIGFYTKQRKLKRMRIGIAYEVEEEEVKDEHDKGL